MDDSLKNRWIEALRSGDYEQGQKSLKTNGTYCCLGVLLEISDDFKWDEDVEEYYTESEGLINFAAQFTDYGVIPFHFQGRIYLEDQEYPDWLKSYLSMRSVTHSVLINMNDIESKSFVEIAQYIETEVD